MKTFLTNVGDRAPIPEDILQKLLGLTEQQMQDFRALNQPCYYVLAEKINNIETERGKITAQICYYDEYSLKNNNYVVFLCEGDEIKAAFVTPSLTQDPPVWNNRTFGFDYHDYLNIQYEIKSFLCRSGISEKMVIDESCHGKMFYTTKETKEEVKKILEENGRYTVVALFAEKVPNLVELAKKGVFEHYVSKAFN